MSTPRILWATTFSGDLYDVSGKLLLASYASTGTPHMLAIYAEDVQLPDAPAQVCIPISTRDPVLHKFLRDHRSVIPRALGGILGRPECRCKGGPFDVHARKHKLPCPGYWFCKNAFRWLRKVYSAYQAASRFREDYDILMWVDSDTRFLRKVPPEVVAGWFPEKTGCIYFKSRRDAIETGIVGYHLQHGGVKILTALMHRYVSGVFRQDHRWDDCVQLEKALESCPDVRSVDLATDVGPNNTVLQFTPLRDYLTHDKGLHRRTGRLS